MRAVRLRWLLVAPLFAIGAVPVSFPCAGVAAAAAQEVDTLHLDQAPPPPPPSSSPSKDTGELAKQLTNPVADLIAVPFVNTFDFGLGPDHDKNAYTLSVQPVIPFSLNEDWNLITRTIVPVIYLEGLTDAGDDNFGLGDIVPSFFFSPKKPWRGWIWGAGPAFLLPTATDTALGTGKWGAGPTAVALRQDGPWTYGMLVNHIWSFAAGDDDRPYVNATFLEPFLAYSTQGGFTVSLLTESTYDWRDRQWTIPIELSFAQVLPVGDHYVQIEVGPTYYAERPAGGPEWGVRLSFVLLFPR